MICAPKPGTAHCRSLTEIKSGQTPHGQHLHLPDLIDNSVFDSQHNQICLHAAAEIDGLLRIVAAALKPKGFRKSDRFKVRMALNEAIQNALKHGNRNDPRKEVRIWWTVTDSSFTAIVEDQGTGFDPAQVCDPRADENRSKAAGRGLLLMRTLMTRVRFNRRGNCVELCKEIAPREPLQPH